MTIAVIVIIAVIFLWFVSTQRKLVAMDENINNAMSQIGVQLSSRWDALTALLDLTKGYAEHEYKTLSDTIKMRAGITAKSTAAEVNNQENILTEAMGRIMAVAESYPDLKANENYIKTMDSVNEYEKMVRQSRLIYNDSVKSSTVQYVCFRLQLRQGCFTSQAVTIWRLMTARLTCRI